MPSTLGDLGLAPVAVIGGGITGLAAAHRLLQLEPSRPVIVLERSGRVGGVLRTEHAEGLLVEHSADMFTTKDPAAWELAQELGLADQLISTNESGRRAFVVRRGHLVPVPPGFVLLRPNRWAGVLSSPLLSWRGKLRLLAERLVPARNHQGDESLESFAMRRLGRETYARLIQPLVGGIYTADPQQLSMAATMPEFLELERRFGRLTCLPRFGRPPDPQPLSPNPASWDHLASGARYAAFLAPRAGMQTLTEALARQLGQRRIRFDQHVTQLVPGEHQRWRVICESAVPDPSGPYAGVIVATPGTVAARLLQEVDSELARCVAEVAYAGSAIALLCYGRDQLTRFQRGFGFVAPACEQRQILAASFASEKFPGRAPADACLVRVFLGGALQAELLQRDDDALLGIAEKELHELLGAEGRPRWSRLIRWEQAMPQYHVGHLQRMERLAQRVARWPGLELAGNAYHGVGIPACIRDGRAAAERLVQCLSVHVRKPAAAPRVGGVD